MGSVVPPPLRWHFTHYNPKGKNCSESLLMLLTFFWKKKISCLGRQLLSEWIRLPYSSVPAFVGASHPLSSFEIPGLGEIPKEYKVLFSWWETRRTIVPSQPEMLIEPRKYRLAGEGSSHDSSAYRISTVYLIFIYFF